MPNLKLPSLLERVAELEKYGWEWRGGGAYLRPVKTRRSLKEAEEITYMARVTIPYRSAQRGLALNAYDYR